MITSIGTTSLGFGEAPLGCYASDWRASRDRLYPEPASPTRSHFQRDRDRILHSTAFRRLNHKTQVFVFHEGDHYRTRLTHTLEVAQIARSLARALRLDEALAEALALAHDLGHPPFGHDGERALQQMMADHGGFDHNGQSLRVVTQLEARYAQFDGLNLTWESLEGLVKHNGPLLDAAGAPIGPYAETGLPFAIADFQAKLDLKLAQFASLEAQAAALADDIAYNAHDIDDGIRSGLLTFEDLASVPALAGMMAEINECYPQLEESRLLHEITRRMITIAVEDAIIQSLDRLSAHAPQSVDDVRAAPVALVAHSDDYLARERQVKAFLKERLYRHPRLLQIRSDARSILEDLFDRYMRAPQSLPDLWRHSLDSLSETAYARRVCDYIAGMTDWFALAEHRRLFDVTPELR